MFQKHFMVAFVIWNTSNVLLHIFLTRKASLMSDALLKYIGLCETFGKGISFYFKLKPQTLGF